MYHKMSIGAATGFETKFDFRYALQQRSRRRIEQVHVLDVRGEPHLFAGAAGGRRIDAGADLLPVDGEEHPGLHAERRDHVERHRELARLVALAAARLGQMLGAQTEDEVAPLSATIARRAALRDRQ